MSGQGEQEVKAANLYSIGDKPVDDYVDSFIPTNQQSDFLKSLDLGLKKYNDYDILDNDHEEVSESLIGNQNDYVS